MNIPSDATLTVEVLLAEYRGLSAQYQKLQELSFRAIQIGFPIASAIAAFLANGDQRLAAGLILAAGVVFPTMWMGFVHSLVNAIGLRLMTIEREVNSELSLTGERKMKWFQFITAGGFSDVSGFIFHSSIASLAGFVMLSVSVILMIGGLEKEGVPRTWAVVLSSIPFAATIAMSICMLVVEGKTKRIKQSILGPKKVQLWPR